MDPIESEFTWSNAGVVSAENRAITRLEFVDRVTGGPSHPYVGPIEQNATRVVVPWSRYCCHRLSPRCFLPQNWKRSVPASPERFEWDRVCRSAACLL